MTDPASLQNLHPIVMPSDVAVFPLAPGWYVAILIVLLVTGRFTVRAVLHWKANWYRREGLQRLEALRKRIAAGEREALPELATLLKGAALIAFPRRRVASLHGEAWRAFLNTTAGSELFSREQGQLLQYVSCCPPASLLEISAKDIDKILQSAGNWLQRHHNKDMKKGDAP